VVEAYVGTIKDLNKLFTAIKSDPEIADVLGYLKHKNTVKWGKIEDFSDLPLDVEDIQMPGSYKIRKGEVFRHSFVSPKYTLIPPKQLLLYVDKELNIVEKPEKRLKIVLFGIKPCDLKAIEVLDRIAEKNENTYYAWRRSMVSLIVVEECLVPGNTCFCGAVGSGPDVQRGFDVSYARLGEVVVFKYGSSRGKQLLEEIGVSRAPDSLVSKYVEALEEARRKTKKAIPPVETIVKALTASIEDEELWRSVSSKCVGCANCNMVCPTCFCLEVVDNPEEEGYARIAQWTGCLSYSYGEVAGGHFRPELYMRYRHFVLHKFVFYPRQIGLLGCVGCGRCITWCPVRVDLRETINKIVSASRR